MNYNTLVSTIPITPKSLKEVKSTGLKDLKALCKDAGINIGGAGREALEILLCIELGIRTSGVDVGDDFGRKIPKCVHHMLDDQQLNEYSCLTPSYLLKQEGWSKDTSQLPDIDVFSIKKYLINSKAQEFTVTSLRHYKLSRAYQHLDANHICNVSFNQLNHSSTFCASKASCIPSQSGNEANIKYVHVIMDKQTGEPYGGFCTCTVGLVDWKKQLCIEKIKYKFNKCSLHVFYMWILSPKWHSIRIPNLH
jgi:hypothetical protein